MFRGESHKPPSVPSFMTSQMLGASALAEDTTSLNEVFKNDPVLSDILHHGEDSRPDSRCWGSVNSILNPKSSLDTEIPNSKPSVFPAFGPAQKITETSPASSAGSGNVPLYLRRAGMASSSDEISESKLNSKQDDPFSRSCQGWNPGIWPSPDPNVSTSNLERSFHRIEAPDQQRSVRRINIIQRIILDHFVRDHTYPVGEQVWQAAADVRQRSEESATAP